MTPHPSSPNAGAAMSQADGAWTLLFLAWLLATVATLGALFLSQVMGVAP